MTRMEHPARQGVRGYIWQAGAVMRAALKRFSEREGAMRAAAIAYHGLLSIFPLLLFLLAISGQVLASTSARQAIDLYLERALPAQAGFVKTVVDQTLQARGSLGVIGLLGLLWSGSGVIGVLTAALNVLWQAPQGPFWRKRVLGALILFSLSLLFLLSLALSAYTAWSAVVKGLSPIRPWLNLGLDVGSLTLMAWALFRLLPNRRVDGRAALVGALVVALLWETAKAAFAWYLASGMAGYGLVYGSLASVIVLVLWAYLSAWILLFGAAVGAAVEQALAGAGRAAAVLPGSEPEGQD